MVDFDNPLQTWTARFARDGYLFGEEPNAFLRSNGHRFHAGDSVLCVADGEGRNSVWLAERGCRVTAFDFASNAIDKARQLAARRGVGGQLRRTAEMAEAVIPDQVEGMAGGPAGDGAERVGE